MAEPEYDFDGVPLDYERRALLYGFCWGLIVALGCLGIGAEDPPPPGTLMHGRPWVGWAVAAFGFLVLAIHRWRLRERP